MCVPMSMSRFDLQPVTRPVAVSRLLARSHGPRRPSHVMTVCGASSSSSTDEVCGGEDDDSLCDEDLMEELWLQDDDVLASITTSISPNLRRSGATWAQVSPNLAQFVTYESEYDSASRSAQKMRRSSAQVGRDAEQDQMSRSAPAMRRSANQRSDYRQARLSRMSEEDLWADVGSPTTTHVSSNLQDSLAPGWARRVSDTPDTARSRSSQSSTTSARATRVSPFKSGRDDGSVESDERLPRGLEKLMQMHLSPVCSAASPWSSGMTPDMPTDALILHVLEHSARPHRCLGLPVDAPAGLIRKRYLALAKRLHPDKLTCAPGSAHEHFTVVKDAARRMLVDRGGGM